VSTAQTEGQAERERETRYSYGGDEWIVVELEEAMSLGANARALAICKRLEDEAIDGVLDVCSSNASYMIRIDPDRLDPRKAVEHLRELEAEVGEAEDFRLETRIIEVPVLFEDEWTLEALMRFRDRHQTPDRTDIEFAAELNGFATKEEFIQAMVGAPFIVSMIGFVPSVPWCYQLVPPDRQIEVPKYVRPRTDTPERAFGWGGAFAAIYPVRGAGGYQLFGRCPAPIVQPAQTLHDFRDSFAFPRTGDVFSFTSVDRKEFDAIRSRVEDGSFRYRIREVEFVPSVWQKDPDATVAGLMEVLHAD
jgi:urea carboxylase